MTPGPRGSPSRRRRESTSAVSRARDRLRPSAGQYTLKRGTERDAALALTNAMETQFFSARRVHTIAAAFPFDDPIRCRVFRTPAIAANNVSSSASKDSPPRPAAWSTSPSESRPRSSRRKPCPRDRSRRAWLSGLRCRSSDRPPDRTMRSRMPSEAWNSSRARERADRRECRSVLAREPPPRSCSTPM